MNCLVADATQWKQQADFYIDRHPMVEARVKSTATARS